MSSAICFNLDQSKFLSSGNGLSLFIKFTPLPHSIPERGKIDEESPMFIP